MGEKPILRGYTNALYTFYPQKATVCEHFEKMHKILQQTTRIFYKKSREKGLQYGNPLYIIKQ